MRAKTRYFVLGSAGIVVAGLCTGLIAYYGGLPTAALQSVGGGPADLAYLPSDSAVVAYANVREVMDSEIRRRLQDREPQSRQGRQEFEERTGIDIERDVDQVVAGILPGDGRTHGVFLVRGRFNQTRIESFARERGATLETYQGKRLLARAQDGNGPVIGFLEGGLVALGEGDAVKRAIDTRRQGSDITGNAEMIGLVREIQAGHNAWAVGRFDALAGRASLPDPIATQVPSIERFSAAGHVDGGLTCLLRAETRDEAAAENLRDVLRGFVALAKLQATDRPELQTFLQSLDLGGTGRTVALSFSVPADLIDAVIPKRAQ
jgi:hypothetical protein